ncbi:MAG: hypothetical protein V3V70_00410 [Candidatus Scalindua sp.]
MKGLSLKVMTLLMAALVLSASGCFNDEMSSPEGTVKGYLKAINKSKYVNVKKMQSYWDPARVPDNNTIVRWYENCLFKVAEEKLGEIDGEGMEFLSGLAGGIRAVSPNIFAMILSISNVKTTLVYDRLGKVWKGDKWHPQKQAKVEVSCKLNEENAQATVKLVKLDNKWYIERWSDFK